MHLRAVENIGLKRIKLKSKTKYDYFAGADGNIYVKKYRRRYKCEAYFILDTTPIKNGRKEYFGEGIFIHYANGEKKLLYVDRLIAETWWGNKKSFRGNGSGAGIGIDKLRVMHRDGNRRNNKPSNLCYSIKKSASFYDILTDEEWKLYNEKINTFTHVSDMRSFNEKALAITSAKLHKLNERSRLDFFKRLFKIKRK